MRKRLVIGAGAAPIAALGLAALGLLLAALAPSTAAAKDDSAAAGRAAKQSLRIWAYFDGDTPVMAGRVRVYADGERLRGDGIAGSNRWTFSDGTALLLVDSLPSELRVVISGGRAGGRPVRGSLKTSVDGADVGDVIEVNPVTTVAEAWDHREDGSDRQARNVTERTLGIHPDLNDADLYATDRWFNGDRFHRWALEQGSVGAAARALVQHIDEPGFDPRLFRPRDDEGREPALAASPKAPFSPGDLLDTVTSHIESAASGTVEGIVIGFVLKGFKSAIAGGFNEQEKKEVNAVEAQLNEISVRLAELETQMANLGFELKVKDTEPLLSKIDAAERDLEYALSGQQPCDPKDPKGCASRKPPPALGTNERNDIFTARTADFLKTAEGLAKPAVAQQLHDLLATTRPGALPPLITGFRAKVGRSSRFFTHESSQEIDRFFEYYKGYEARLAELQAEYYTLRGDPQLTPAQNLVTAKDRVQIIKKVFLPAQKRLMPEADMDPRIFIDTNNQTDRDKMNLWATRTSARAGTQILEDGLLQKTNAQCGVDFYIGSDSCRTELVNRPHFVPGLGTDIFPPGYFPGPQFPWYIPTYQQVTDVLGPDPLARLDALGVRNDGAPLKAGSKLWLRDRFYLVRQDRTVDNVEISARELVLKATGGGSRAEWEEFVVAERCTRNLYPSCPTRQIRWGTTGLILWSFGRAYAISDLYW